MLLRVTAVLERAIRQVLVTKAGHDDTASTMSVRTHFRWYGSVRGKSAIPWQPYLGIPK
jgi:hypothetical protein